MTETGAVRRKSLRRGTLLILLFSVSLALAGGTQALAPAPATAMIGDGEECGEPTVDCEPGGGAGGSGGGSSDTVGSETIVIHDTRPSPCQLSPSSCLPSGGRSPGGRPGDGGGPHAPRHGGRPARVADAAGARDCGRFSSALNRINDRLFRVGVVLNGLEAPFQERVGERVELLERRGKLRNLLVKLRGGVETDKILWAEGEIAGLTARIDAMLLDVEKLEEQVLPWHKLRADLRSQANAATRSLKRCTSGGTGGKGGGPAPPPIEQIPGDRFG
jgi:hypothetical protein